jgi:hypothetical protein
MNEDPRGSITPVEVTMFRKRHVARATLLAAAALFVAGAAFASSSSIGLRGGFSSGPDQVVVGAHFQPPPVAKQLYIVPSGEVGFGDDAFTIAVNGDLEYQFTSSGNVRPYAGGGLSLYYIDVDQGGSDSNLGVSALGGLLFDRSKGWPIFLEAKLGLSNEVPDFKLVAGLMFR